MTEPSATTRYLKTLGVTPEVLWDSTASKFTINQKERSNDEVHGLGCNVRVYCPRPGFADQITWLPGHSITDP